MNDYNYKRRKTYEVSVGNVKLGADGPIRLQSMTNTPTADVNASVEQAERIIRAGGEIVRLTAQGVREAQAMGEIRQLLDLRGLHQPMVADIHFNPRAAFAAAEVVEKVRINPGNFVDPGRVFKHIEYTDEEYKEELQRVEQAFAPLVELCRKHHTALRIGVNHGSLSDRIMSRFGNTPQGMVESAMEFVRICHKMDFNDVVISIKASNVKVMVETMRLLARTLDRENMPYPLHLGVTEAGEGEDGRIKSALGIGTLLAEGLGDTIRVSLCEDPECEIPVARELVDYIGNFAQPHDNELITEYDNPIANNSETKVVGLDIPMDEIEKNGILITCKTDIEKLKSHPRAYAVIDPAHVNRPAHFRVLINEIRGRGYQNPIILKESAHVLRASVDLGGVLLSGLLQGIWITGDRDNELALSLLQAARIRMTRTEFIACPSCGRTMFDLQTTLRQVKAATAHLSGLKIGVMGCIVNGPGEMADADYGYVGSSRGHINLYKGKECVEKNIPQEQGVERLIALIRAHGDWKEPE